MREIEIQHPSAESMQQLMDELCETVSFDRTPGDWRMMPETEPPDD
jgi:hypothetical protein